MNYKEYKLKDVVDVLTKTINPSKNSDTTFQLYSLPAFDNNKTVEIIKGAEISSNKIIINKNVTLFNKLNLRFKRIWYVENPSEYSICSTEYIPIYSKVSFLNNKYLYYYMLSDQINAELTKASSGTSNSHQRINKDLLLDKVIKIPSLEDQNRIVSILSDLDKLIEANEESIRKNYNLIRKIFNDIFNEEYDKDKLGNYIEIINGHAFKSNEFVKKGIPVVKIKNIKTNKVVLNDFSYIDDNMLETYSKYLIGEDDLVITMTGNRIDGSRDSWVGKACLFNIDGNYLLNQRLAIINTINDKVSKFYLINIMSSDDMQDYLIKRATSSGGQANISPDLIKNIEIPIPSTEKIKKFDKCVRNIYSLIHLNENSNIKFEILKHLYIENLIDNM